MTAMKSVGTSTALSVGRGPRRMGRVTLVSPSNLSPLSLVLLLSLCLNAAVVAGFSASRSPATPSRRFHHHRLFSAPSSSSSSSSSSLSSASMSETDSATTKAAVAVTTAKPSSSSSDKSPSISSYNQLELETKFPKFPRTYVPLASTFELDPNRPNPVQVFGQRYVVYQHPTSKQWIVMDDACPHRLAPLSEGRIVLPLPSKQEKNNNKNKDDAESSSSSASIGDIQCSYHGWSFNSDGQCTSIPQASPDVERAALSGKQCNVPTYSTIIDRSIIWFWPWKQDVIEATINAAAAATNKDDGAASPGGGWDITPSGLMKGCPPADLPNTYTRELPYSYDILVENLLDPSHVPFAHHGLQGSRSDAIPIEMSLPTSDGITERGFTFEWTDRTMGMMRNGEGRWQAPYTVLYDAKFYEQDPPRDFNLAVLCVPVRAGWSRAILFGPGGKNSTSSDSDSSSTIDKDVGSVAEADSSITDEKTRQSSSFKTTLIKAIFAAIPIWIVHQLNNKFLDSDLAFLHYQDLERSRRQQVSAAAASSVSNRKDDYYFMPAASDRCIAALRSWFAKYTDLSALGPVTVELSRVEMFNRWSQHTSKCVHCQNGLKQLAKARKILFGITALSAVGFNASILAKAAFFISLTLQPFISKIEQSMMEGEFKHYENH